MIFKVAQFLAGRWAAKEAIIKAYNSRRLTFHDISILPPTSTSTDTGSRPPVAVVKSESGDWEDGEIVPLSISHDGDYAIATCMAYEPAPGAVFETAEDVNKALRGTDHGTSEGSEIKGSGLGTDMDKPLFETVKYPSFARYYSVKGTLLPGEHVSGTKMDSLAK